MKRKKTRRRTPASTMTRKRREWRRRKTRRTMTTRTNPAMWVTSEKDPVMTRMHPNTPRHKFAPGLNTVLTANIE